MCPGRGHSIPQRSQGRLPHPDNHRNLIHALGVGGPLSIVDSNSQPKVHACGKTGHFKAMCRSRKNVGTVESTKDDQPFKGVVQQQKSDNRWTITLEVNGKPIKFKIDTGADITVIPHDAFKSIPGATLNPTSEILSGPNQKILPCSERTVHGKSQTSRQGSQ